MPSPVGKIRELVSVFDCADLELDLGSAVSFLNDFLRHVKPHQVVPHSFHLSIAVK